jgi:RNA polymerase sigma factor (TIGR02999 family)
MASASDPPPRQDVTQLLAKASAGDEAAGSSLFIVVYDELRRVAAAALRRERPDHTLQPTALVHEAWLRLVDEPARDLVSREHFLSLSARVMRRVLVDHAREQGAQKRGGGRAQVTLDGAVALYETRNLDLAALDEALEKLAARDAQLVRLVELRFFAGLSNDEVARVEGASLRSVERGWATARAFLRGALGD